LDDDEFKIEFNGTIYTQKFPYSYTALKIYLFSCFTNDENKIELRYVTWNTKKSAPIFDYPYIAKIDEIKEQVPAKIIYVRERTFKRNSWIRDVFYLKDDKNFIHIVDYPWFFDYKKHLKIGDIVDLKIKKYDNYDKLLLSEFIFKSSIEKEYQKGDELIAKVLNPQPNGAICITEDDEIFFLSKQKLINKTNKVDISTVLSPSDEILVSYESNSPSELGDKHRQFNFIKLENRIFESDKLKDILDLKVTYTKGISGGFGRNSDFREMVLNYYNHVCALCDDYLIYGKFSSAEAAHIVPRSSRGVNKIENSLCLCKEHHWSFDRGFWTIDEIGKVIISDELLSDANFKAKYEKFQYKETNEIVRTKINPDSIEWHRRNIFKK
jgi:hypothetical protein